MAVASGGSERQIVASGGVRVTIHGGVVAAPFLPEVRLHLVEVEGRHRLAQVVEQFEDASACAGVQVVGMAMVVAQWCRPAGGGRGWVMTCVRGAGGRVVRYALVLP